jgi:tetratricopeptide (TPR) repeat protein
VIVDRGRIFLLFLLAACIALTAARNRLWTNELTIWKDAGDKSPRKSRVHDQLGRLYHEVDRRKALEQLLIAARMDPDADAFCNVGAAYNEFGMTDEAIDFFQRALALDPGHLPAHFNYGTALLKKGMLEAARHEFSYVLHERPDDREAARYLSEIIRLQDK